jgi:hypothetical protein
MKCLADVYAFQDMSSTIHMQIEISKILQLLDSYQQNESDEFTFWQTANAACSGVMLSNGVIAVRSSQRTMPKL